MLNEFAMTFALQHEWRGEIATLTEIGVARDTHEINVCDMAGKVADGDAILDRVVDGIELLPIAAWAKGESAQSILVGFGKRIGWAGAASGRGRLLD